MRAREQIPVWKCVRNVGRKVHRKVAETAVTSILARCGRRDGPLSDTRPTTVPVAIKLLTRHRPVPSDRLALRGRLPRWRALAVA